MDALERSAVVLARELDRTYKGEEKMALTLRQTWLPNIYGVEACIWCDMPAARCVIEEPCEGRKKWEAQTVTKRTA